MSTHRDRDAPVRVQSRRNEKGNAISTDVRRSFARLRTASAHNVEQHASHFTYEVHLQSLKSEMQVRLRFLDNREMIIEQEINRLQELFEFVRSDRVQLIAKIRDLESVAYSSVGEIG